MAAQLQRALRQFDAARTWLPATRRAATRNRTLSRTPICRPSSGEKSNRPLIKLIAFGAKLWRLGERVQLLSPTIDLFSANLAQLAKRHANLLSCLCSSAHSSAAIVQVQIPDLDKLILSSAWLAGRSAAVQLTCHCDARPVPPRTETPFRGRRRVVSTTINLFAPWEDSG